MSAIHADSLPTEADFVRHGRIAMSLMQVARHMTGGTISHESVLRNCLNIIAKYPDDAGIVRCFWRETPKHYGAYRSKRWLSIAFRYLSPSDVVNAFLSGFPPTLTAGERKDVHDFLCTKVLPRISDIELAILGEHHGITSSRVRIAHSEIATQLLRDRFGSHNRAKDPRSYNHRTEQVRHGFVH